MVLQKGEFILADYTGKVKETGEVFDTTIEEIAKKERLYKEGELYEPKLIVVGEGWVLKALDDGLATMEVGKTNSVEIPQEKGFGPRDPEKMKRVHLKQLVAKGITPSLGMRVEFGDKMATVRAIGAGRVLLDFNPPLAGRTLIYEVTVKQKLEANEEKIHALIHRRVPAVDANKFEFSLKPKMASIEMPEEAFYLEGVQVAKRGIALDIQKFLPQITTVRFNETFKSEGKDIPPKRAESKAEAKEEEDKSKGQAESKAEA